MQSLINIANRIRAYAVQLNFFENGSTRLDQFHLRTTIISTRVYTTLLTLAIIVIVVVTSLVTQSEVNYQTLLKKKLTQLLCSCSRITIPYGNFTSTMVTYHLF
ncbi:unnamed protein product [Adineta ricciae]|uniref:Uncharacterized protein n=1 Tax=Adineta ricciae TaxID=249248 RepID=A0A815AYC0_ADIRI|nr:unnamed protein product [Adineta ricciae]